jgi:hypothetical protein
MRIAKLHMDAQDKTRFEIHGKSSVKYHLKANHVVEAKRWFWALNNAIQWAKDEAKEEERRKTRGAEAIRQAKMDQMEGRLSEALGDSNASVTSKQNTKGLAPATTLKSTSSFSRISTQTSRTAAETIPGDDDGSAYGSYDPSIAQNDVNRTISHMTGSPDGDGESEDFGDYASSHDVQPANKDAFSITAQSAKLQLDLLSNVASSLLAEKSKNPSLTVSDPAVDRALSAYHSAVSSLNGLLADLLKISRDRDAYWQYRLDKEADTRKMWEDSMARIVQEHEELQNKIGESEDKRKRTKKALKEVLENTPAANSRPTSNLQMADAAAIAEDAEEDGLPEEDVKAALSTRRQSTVAYVDLAEFESDEDEFYDAIDAGGIEVEELIDAENLVEKPAVNDEVADLRTAKHKEIISSSKGYEDPPRQRLKMEIDDRPKISLWVSHRQEIFRSYQYSLCWLSRVSLNP